MISTHVSEKTELQVVLTGDFNLDVLDEEHPHFRHYQYFLASFDLLNYVHQPTRYGQTKWSCLDLYILLTDEASLVRSCTPVPSIVETDHELVFADLLIAKPPSPPPVQPPYRNIKNINASFFCNDLENQNLATFSNGKNADSMWLEWIEKFNEVLDRYGPLRSLQSSHRKVQRRTRCNCPWTGLEKSAAIRPFATKKSRLANEKILLADSLATESCRLADRLATKLFFKADNADADRTWSRKVFGRRLCRSKMQRELAVRARRSCLRVNPPPVSIGAFPEILLPRPSELCGAEKISYALWLSVCAAH